MKKIISLIKASPVAVVIAGLVIVGVASAALVNYLSKTLVSENVPIASPIEITGGSLWDWNIGHGGNADITLVTLKNNAEVPISGTAELAVKKYDGGWQPHSYWEPGMQLAISGDINYAWMSEHNPDNIYWRIWLETHLNLMDWVLSDPHDLPNLERYNTTEISPLDVGPGGRDGVLGYTNNKDTGDPDGDRDVRAEITWDENKGAWMISGLGEIPAGAIVRFAVWVVTYPEIEPGTYQFRATVRPTVAPMEAPEYKMILEIQGSGSTTTEAFTLTDDPRFLLHWNFDMLAEGSPPSNKISLYKKGKGLVESFKSQWGYSGEITKPGEYYFDIETYVDNEWVLQVVSYRMYQAY